MSQLTVDLTTFVLKDTIFLTDDEGHTKKIASVDIADLPSTLVSIGVDKKVFNVHLYGSEVLCNEIINQMNDKGTEYSRNNFIIEVN